MRDAAEDGIAAASVYIGLGCCGNTRLVTSYLNNTSRKKPQHCAKFFVLSVISAFYQLTVQNEKDKQSKDQAESTEWFFLVSVL